MPREATKAIRRVLLLIRLLRVGHILGILDAERGVYASLSIPDAENSLSICAGVALSELTMRTVTTSFVFASIHVLISDSQLERVPASKRLQLVWHRCHESDPLSLNLCTYALSIRTPDSS